MDWAMEQEEWFGLSSTLVYKNYCVTCANIFVGGANKNSKNDWTHAVTRMTEAGVATTLFHLDQDVGDDGKHPFIDHMHLDDSSVAGEEWLFGTTKSKDSGAAGDFIYPWKVKLDANHDPDPTTSFVSKIENNDIDNEGYIIGIKPTLVGGDMHGVWHRSDKKIYYFYYDWTISTLKTVEIHDKAEFPAFAVFGGFKTEPTTKIACVFQEGFIGVSKKEYDDAAAKAFDRSDIIGAILSTLVETEGCLIPRGNVRDLKF